MSVQNLSPIVWPLLDLLYGFASSCFVNFFLCICQPMSFIWLIMFISIEKVIFLVSSLSHCKISHDDEFISLIWISVLHTIDCCIFLLNQVFYYSEVPVSIFNNSCFPKTNFNSTRCWITSLLPFWKFWCHSKIWFFWKIICIIWHMWYTYDTSCSYWYIHVCI